MSTGGVNQHKQWCLEARKILKLGKRGDLKSRATKVAKQLETLRKIGGPTLQKHADEFKKIATELHNAKDAQEVERLSLKLSELKKKINVELSSNKSQKVQAKAQQKLEARQATTIPSDIELMKKVVAKAETDFGSEPALKPELDALRTKLADAQKAYGTGDMGTARDLLDDIPGDAEQLGLIAAEYEEYADERDDIQRRLNGYKNNVAVAAEVKQAQEQYLDEAQKKARVRDFDAANRLVKQADTLVGLIARKVNRFNELQREFARLSKDLSKAKLPQASPHKDVDKIFQEAVNARKLVPQAPKTLEDYESGVKAIRVALQKIDDYEYGEEEALNGAIFDFQEEYRKRFQQTSKLPPKAPEGLEKEHGDVTQVQDKLTPPNTFEEVKARTALLGDLDEKLKAYFEAAEKQLTECEDDLKKLQPQYETFASKVSGNNFIRGIRARLMERMKEAKKQMKKKNVKAVQVAITAMRPDLDKIEKTFEKLEAARAKLKTVEDKEVADALKAKIEPEKLAQVRTAGLDRTKKAIEELIHGGKFPAAEKKIEEWKKQAETWVKSQGAAKEVHETLSAKPVDDKKLTELLKAEGGAQVLDDLVLSLGEAPSKQAMQAVMKARFGVTLKLKKVAYKRNEKTNKWEKDENGKLKKFETPDGKLEKGSKSVQRIYELMTKIPPAQAKNDKLRKIVRISGKDDTDKTPGKKRSIESGNWYRERQGEKGGKIQLACGRQGERNKRSIVGDPAKLPGVDEDCKPRPGAPVPKAFDWTTLHEIGHAVDDALRFMGKHNDQKDFGGWKMGLDSSPCVAAAERHFTVDGHSFPTDKITELLAGAPKKTLATNPAPTPLPDKMDAQKWEAKWKECIAWCNSIRHEASPWDNPNITPIDGKIYMQAYDHKWGRYLQDARKKGITGYQFRAPGEWFAELYAAYHCDQLSDTHPAIVWLETL